MNSEQPTEFLSTIVNVQYMSQMELHESKNKCVLEETWS